MRGIGEGGGGREQIKGRSLVCVDIWVPKKNISNRVLAPSHLSYPMRHAWDLAPNRDDRLLMRPVSPFFRSLSATLLGSLLLLTIFDLFVKSGRYARTILRIFLPLSIILCIFDIGLPALSVVSILNPQKRVPSKVGT